MRNSALGRALAACLVTLGLTLPASADMGRVLGFLTQTPEEEAAAYLAGVIDLFGCEIRVEEQRDFTDTLLMLIAFEMGVDVAAYERDGVQLATGSVRQGLFDFGYRAGPILLEQGALVLEEDGTARLTSCSRLTS